MILIDWLVVPESQFLAHITVMTAKWCVYNLDLIAIHSFFEINWASWPRKRKIPMNRKTSNQSKSKIGLRLAAYHPVNQTFSIKQQYFNRFLYRIYSTPNHDVPADHHCSLRRALVKVTSRTHKSSLWHLIKIRQRYCDSTRALHLWSPKCHHGKTCNKLESIKKTQTVRLQLHSVISTAERPNYSS